MNMNLTVNYYKCQTCSSKVNCKKCDAQKVEDLLEIDGINAAEIDLAKKTLFLDTTLDRDDLEEELEDLGLFIM